MIPPRSLAAERGQLFSTTRTRETRLEIELTGNDILRDTSSVKRVGTLPSKPKNRN